MSQRDFDELLSQLIVELTANSQFDDLQVSEIVSTAVRDSIAQAAAMMLKTLRRSAPKMIRERNEEDAGFNKRNYRRWKKAFDLLELIWVISEEAGCEFNQHYRPNAVETKDYKFEALTSLHSRSLLVTREAICLMLGGFPDGALSRWRTLHEQTTIAVFLAHHDDDIAHRYLASHFFSSYRAAKQLEQYAERANMKRFSKEELEEMKDVCDGFVARFDDDMWHDYGWAAPALNNHKPNFSIIEKSVGLDHWRPRYRWASQHTHGPHRPTHALLGMAEAQNPVLLVGQSNSGMVDPLQMTAMTLTLVTSTLLLSRHSFEQMVTVEVLRKLSDEIGPLALELEKRTLERQRARDAISGTAAT